MEITLKCFARKYATKEGSTFIKTTTGSTYFPQELKDKLASEDGVYFNVQPCYGSDRPSEEGTYDITFDLKNAWIDVREGFKERLILRLRDCKVERTGDLPKKKC